jgi:hypothetical protein
VYQVGKAIKMLWRVLRETSNEWQRDTALWLWLAGIVVAALLVRARRNVLFFDKPIPLHYRHNSAPVKQILRKQSLRRRE